MSAKGDLMLAWAVDPLIRERGESGGAVTALLAFALREGIVDAVIGVKKGADIYDAMPVLITDPHEVMETAGSILGGTLLLSKLFGKYLKGLKDLKVAAALKGCDVMGVYEQAKEKAAKSGKRFDDRPELWRCYNSSHYEAYNVRGFRGGSRLGDKRINV